MRYVKWLMLCVLSIGCTEQAKSISPIVESRVDAWSSVLNVTKSVEVKTDESLVLLKDLAGKVDTLQEIADSNLAMIDILASVKDTPVVEAEPVVVSEETPVVEDTWLDDMIVVNTEEKVRLQFWTATWCGLCPEAKEQAKAAADTLGVRLEVFDIDEDASQKDRVRVKAPPTLCIVYNGGIRKWMTGINSKAKILAAVEFVKSRNVASYDDQVIPENDFPAMKALHDGLHGGGDHPWPGDLATHLRETHGVNLAASTASVMTRQTMRAPSRTWTRFGGSNCPSGNCPRPRRSR